MKFGKVIPFEFWMTAQFMIQEVRTEVAITDKATRKIFLRKVVEGSKRLWRGGKDGGLCKKNAK